MHASRQARITNFDSHWRERRCRSAPSQLLNITEEWLVDTQRSESFEKEGALAVVLTQNLEREVLEPAVTVYELGSCFWSVTFQSRISIRRVAHEREIVRNERRRNSKLSANTLRISNHAPPTIHLDHALTYDALREILIRRPDAYLLHTVILGRKVCRGSKRVVGLKLYHGPYGHAHRDQRLLERVELRQQGPLNACTSFVLWPKTVTE